MSHLQAAATAPAATSSDESRMNLRRVADAAAVVCMRSDMEGLYLSEIGKMDVLPAVRDAVTLCRIVDEKSAPVSWSWLLGCQPDRIIGHSAPAQGDDTRALSAQRALHGHPLCGEGVCRVPAGRRHRRGRRVGSPAAANRCFSDYDTDSELNQLTQPLAPAYQRPVPVSDELWQVLDFADRMSRAYRWSRRCDGGTTDAVVASCAAAGRAAGWRSAGSGASPGRLSGSRISSRPPRDTLAAVGPAAGSGRRGQRVRRGRGLSELHRHGLDRALIDAGGDLAIGQPPPDRPGWPVYVAPTGDQQQADDCLLLQHCGVATSGAAARGVRIGGQLLSHIIDPRTGMALTHGRAVTLVARTR